MKKRMGLICSSILLATHIFAADVDGVRPGEWTMDLAAAKTYAAEHQLPVLLNFSGSDWCHWCQLMEKNVFSQPDWTSYAASNVVMVLVDFPRDKSLVPEKYAARNDALNAEYGVEGFPTFVVLDDDGITELGRLTAGEEKTPASFQGELTRLFRNRASAQAAFVAGLTPEDQETYESMTRSLKQKTSELEKISQDAAALMARSDVLQEEMMGLEGELRTFRIAQRGDEALAEYKALEKQLKEKEQVLEAWIQTQPEQNEENLNWYNTMRSELMAIYEKMEAF
jgi:thiol-disulfide isomerase/thioredoxin